MAAFDQTLARERARQRRDKALKRTTSQKRMRELELRYGRDLIAISGICKLLAWCTQRSVVVEFTKSANGTWSPDENTIEINGRCSPENQLFWLLHECGHALIDRSAVQRYGTIRSNPHHRSLIVKVQEVAEELEAWDRGYNLVKRLGIYVNPERYIMLRAEAVATYFK
jgi:hypothetical protein